MDNLAVISAISVVVIIGAAYGFKKYEEYKLGRDPYELLKDFSQLIIYTAQKVMETLNVKDYSSEQEYRDKLADIVSQELYLELKDSEFKDVLKYVDENSIKKFVLQVFTLAKGEIKITEIFSEKLIELSDVDDNKTTESLNVNNGNKVDITSSLMNEI